MSNSRILDDTPALSIQDLRKRYGKTNALDGVVFKLHQGERLGLLGPNGAGKTTLVRCIARRIRADQGDIVLLGEPMAPTGTSPSLGIVPQELAIYEDLSAYQNLYFFGRFHGLRGRELKHRIHWALEWTGLKDRSSQLVRHFSGGMKRRINLACGVMHSPRVLLLDEPTVGVDPQSRERIYVMIDSLSEEGCSILLTTHHMEEAEWQCDRLVIMDRGRVVADGTIDELIDQSVGPSRSVRLRIDGHSLRHHPREFGFLRKWEPEIVFRSDEEQVVELRMNDVAQYLPAILEQLSAQSVIVRDIEVQPPSLHDVFLALTGKHLRDV